MEATSPPGAGRPAAFLDRDGTLNVSAPEHEYVTALEHFVWLPGAIEGAAALARAGYVLAVVSNQRGIARGLLTEATLSEIEAEIQAALAPHGARVEAFRYCPHELDADCDCRKPKPGMLLELARTLGLDLARSWMIGDSPSDVQAGRAAGTHTALITPAPAAGGRATSVAGPDADITAPTLREIAAAIAG
ncbi:MAG TPA: HAD family hydrolase [Solirubrobacteraceae bacterium]